MSAIMMQELGLGFFLLPCLLLRLAAMIIVIMIVT
jgi:hypothetical protein